MSSRLSRPLFHAAATALVTLILFGAMTLSISALLENHRFAQASSQIFTLVNQVRQATTDQKNFAQTQGEDVWGDLVTLGRIAATSHRTNPWNGTIRALSTTDGMRIENDLPVHECRRLALSFLDHKPADLGLLSIEAQTYSDSKWTLVYPLQGNAMTSPRAAELACGTAPYARLALIFKIR